MMDYCGSKCTPIQQFYKDQTIFITGGTGFVGQVLIEKLLRTCPDIKKIYLLIREKKAKKSEERMKDLFDSKIYDTLKMVYPNFKEKVVFIPGNIADESLGISEKDQQTIINNVTIVIHLAATVRFDEKLKIAALTNVQATHHIMKLCSKCKHLKSVVHTSTAYSHCYKEETSEVFYPPTMDPDKLLEMCNTYSDEQLDTLTPKIIGSYPNTYVFTKGLAEDIVRSYNKKLPLSVVRPSIIMGCWKEPIAGWQENIYGPLGVMYGIGLGVVRTFPSIKTKKSDIIPVDLVSNCIIAAAYKTSLQNYKTKDIAIYHICSGKQNPVRWMDLVDWTLQFARVYSPSVSKWYMYVNFETSELSFKINNFLQHTIPGFLIDTYLKCTGQKPQILKMYKKLDKLVDILRFFSTNEWTFHNNNTIELYDSLDARDKILYLFDITNVQWDTFFYNLTRCIRLYMYNDPLDNVLVARKRMFRLQILHYVVVFSFFALIAFIMYLFLKMFSFIFSF